MRCDPDAVVRSMRWLRMITVGRGPRMVGELRFVFHAPRTRLQLHKPAARTSKMPDQRPLSSIRNLSSRPSLKVPCCHTRGNKNTRHKEP